MTRTRYKIGQQQAAILATLSGHDVMLTIDLSFALHGEPPYLNTASVGASLRRSLALLLRKGLVSNGGTRKGERECWLDHPGRPTRWRITDAGREYLAQGADAPGVVSPAAPG
jgi:hypothetical protein